jgi:hypothetical protein
MDVLLISVVGVGVFVALATLVIKLLLKRPLKDIVSDWLAQFF